MTEILSRVSPGDMAAVIIVPILAIAGVLAMLAILIVTAVQHYREREIAATVVMEMLERGLGTEEIIAVLKAMGLEPNDSRRAIDRFRHFVRGRPHTAKTE